MLNSKDDELIIRRLNQPTPKGFDIRDSILDKCKVLCDSLKCGMNDPDVIELYIPGLHLSRLHHGDYFPKSDPLSIEVIDNIGEFTDKLVHLSGYEYVKGMHILRINDTYVNVVIVDSEKVNGEKALFNVDMLIYKASEDTIIDARTRLSVLNDMNLFHQRFKGLYNKVLTIDNLVCIEEPTLLFDRYVSYVEHGYVLPYNDYYEVKHSVLGIELDTGA